MIRGSIRFPHAVAVATLLAVLFGVISLMRIPLQLRPTIDPPEVTVTTLYPGASPEEVEDKITRPIEEELNTVQGVRRLSSTSTQGRSRVTLEFDLDVDRDAALVDVLNKLGQVRDLPEEADRPVAEAISGDTTMPIMWVGLQAQVKNPRAHVNRMRTLADDVIEPRIRRVDGVGSLIVGGGQEREVRVEVSMRRLAERRVPMARLIRVIRESHLTVRGGPLDVGKREYVVWTTGRQNDLDAVGDIVLGRTAQGIARLRDVAHVVAGHKRADTLMRQNGQEAVALGVIRKTGANVPATARKVEAAMAELNRDFAQRDLPYRLKVLSTEVTYIDEAISLVTGNLMLGSFLAVAVLILFLGSIRSVLVIAVSIPTSIITVFIVLDTLGRTMNIVSLAGLAFAAGMVVDNAIVVLENIYRRLNAGDDPDRAAYDGTRHVALAIASSTATTVAVFLPIIFLKSEAGQIFKDIAIAISFAVIFSLIASLTIVPMLARRLLRPSPSPGRLSLYRLALGVDRFLEGVYGRLLGRLLGPGNGPARLAVVLLALGIFLTSLSFLPPSEYLPGGNRNLIITLAKPLPGMRLEKTSEAIRPLERKAMSQPETERTFLVFSARFSALGTVLKPEHSSEEDLERMLSRLRRETGSIAGFQFLFPMKASIFRVPGKQFEVEIVGPDLDRLAALSRLLTERLRQVDGVVDVRSDFQDGALNLQVTPNRLALAEQDLTPAQLADTVQVSLGGLKVGAFLDRGREIDLTLVGPEGRLTGPDDLRAVPIATGRGQVSYLDNLASVDTVQGPTEVNRVEMQRAVTLTVSLRRDAALGAVMDRVDRGVLDPLRAALPSTFQVRLGETADRLRETLSELQWSFLLALLISYLLMVALFRSVGYPLIILASVPLGATGAFISVSLAGVPFDTITMLGLIILSGVVVNNAILVVDQSLRLHREGLSFDEALLRGATSRLRPIVMTATTSVLGMLPLAMGSGSGAELYRGLGVAIVGGLTLSTMVTLVLVPSLLALTRDFAHHFLPRRAQGSQASAQY